MKCTMKKDGDILKCIRCGNTMNINGGILPNCGEKYPPLLIQATTLTKSIINYMSNSGEIVSNIDYQVRLDICKSCEYYDNARCIKCGCFFAGKLKLSTEECPIGKWGQITKQKP